MQKLEKFVSVCSINFGSNNFVDTTRPLHHPRSHKFSSNSMRRTKGSDSKTVYCNKILFAPKKDGKAKPKMSSKIHKFCFSCESAGKKSANMCQNHDYDICSCLDQNHCKNHRNEGITPDLLRPWFVFIYLLIIKKYKNLLRPWFAGKLSSPEPKLCRPAFINHSNWSRQFLEIIYNIQHNMGGLKTKAPYSWFQVNLGHLGGRWEHLCKLFCLAVMVIDTSVFQ